MQARSFSLGLRLLWRPLGFSLYKCVHILYAYKVFLKFSSKCIHPNYLFYCFDVPIVSIEFVIIYRPHPVHILFLAG
jgi:hypothetical protein